MVNISMCYFNGQKKQALDREVSKMLEASEQLKHSTSSWEFRYMCALLPMHSITTLRKCWKTCRITSCSASFVRKHVSGLLVIQGGRSRSNGVRIVSI